MERIGVSAVFDVAEFNNGLHIYLHGLEQATGATSVATSQMNSFGGAFTAGLGAAVGIAAVNTLSQIAEGIKNVGLEALNSVAFFERFQMSVSTLMARDLRRSTGYTVDMATALEQTQRPAEGLFKELQKLAILSPFSTQDLAISYRTAAAYGFTTNEALRLTKAITDFSAASGFSRDEMQRISLALAQVRSRGKLAAQEVNQLSQAGVEIRGIINRELGIAFEDIDSQMEKGLIPAGKVLEAVVSSFEKDFGGFAARAATSFAGLQSTMEDLKQIGLAEFFRGTFEQIRPFVVDFINLFQNNTFLASLRVVGDVLGMQVANAINMVKSALGGLATLISGIPAPAMQFAATFALVGAALTTIASVAGLVSLALIELINPFTVIVGAISFMSAAWISGFGEVESVTKDVANSVVGIMQDLADQAVGWGTNIVDSLAAGISSGVGIITDALSVIGDMVTFLLQPGSPPNLLPNLDKWGTAAAQVYMDAWGLADFKALDKLGAEMEKKINAFVKMGNIDELDAVRMVQNLNQTLAAAVDQFVRTGQVGQEMWAKLTAAAGPAAQELQQLLPSYLQLTAETTKVTVAQEKLNQITERYRERLFDLNAALKEIQNARSRNDEAKELRKLQRVVSTRYVSEFKMQDALTRIKEIGIQREIRETEAQADSEKSAWQKQLDAAKALQDALQKTVDLMLARFDAQNSQLGLYGEEETILKRLERANKQSEKQGKKALTLLELQLEKLKFQQEEVKDTVELAKARYILEDSTSTEIEKQNAMLTIRGVELRRQQREEEAAKLGITDINWEQLRSIPVTLDDMKIKAKEAKDAMLELFQGVNNLDLTSSLDEFNEKVTMVQVQLRIWELLTKKYFDRLNASLPAFLQFNKALDGTIPLLETLKTVFTGLAAGVGTAKVIQVIQGIVTGMGAIATKSNIIIGAVSLLASAWVGNWFDIQGAVGRAVDFIVSKWNELMQNSGIQKITASFAEFGAQLNTLWIAFLNYERMPNIFRMQLRKVLGTVNEFVGNIITVVTNAGPYLRDRFLTDWLPGFTAWAYGLVLQAGPIVGGFAEAIINGVITYAPIIASKLVTEWLPALLDWAWKAAISIGPALWSLGSAIFAWQLQTAMNIKDRIEKEWIPAFTGWTTYLSSTIVPYLTNFVRGVIGVIIANAPIIATKLRDEWIPSFISWLGGLWTSTSTGLSSFLSNMQGWIAYVATFLRDEVTKVWVPALSKWVQGWVEYLLPQLQLFVSGVQTWIQETAATIENSIQKEWIPAFVDWLYGLPTALLRGLNKVYDTIADSIGFFSPTLRQQFMELLPSPSTIFMRFTRGIRTEFKKINDAISEAVGNLTGVGGQGNIFDQIFGADSTVGSRISATIITINTAIQAFKGIIGSASSALAVAGTGFTSLSGALSAARVALAALLSTGTGATLRGLSSGLKSVSAALIGLFRPAAPAMTGGGPFAGLTLGIETMLKRLASTNIVDVLLAPFQKFGPKLRLLLIGQLGELGADVTSKWGSLAHVMSNAFKASWTAGIQETLRAVVAILADGIERMDRIVPAGFKGIASGIRTALGFVRGIVADAFGGIASTLGGFKGAILEVLVSPFRLAGGAMEGALARVIPAFQGFGRTVLNLFLKIGFVSNGVGDVISRVFTTVFGGTATRAVGLLEGAILRFLTVGERVIAWVTGTFSTLGPQLAAMGREAFTALGSLMAGSVGGAMRTVEGLFLRLSSVITGSVTPAVEGLGGSISRAMSAVKSVVGGTLGTLRTVISELSTSFMDFVHSSTGVGNAISRVFSSVRTVLGGVAEFLAGGFVASFEKVLGLLGSIPSKIISALGSLRGLDIFGPLTRGLGAVEKGIFSLGDMLTAAFTRGLSIPGSLTNKVVVQFKWIADKIDDVLDLSKSGKMFASLSDNFYEFFSGAIDKVFKLFHEFPAVIRRDFGWITSIGVSIREAFTVGNVAKPFLALFKTLGSLGKGGLPLLGDLAGGIGKGVFGVIAKGFSLVKTSIGGVMGLIKGLLSPMNIIGFAIGFIVDEVVKNWSTIAGFFGEFAGMVGKLGILFSPAVLGQFGDAMQGLFSGTEEGQKKFQAFFSSITSYLKAWTRMVAVWFQERVLPAFLGWAQQLPQKLGGYIVETVKSTLSLIQWAGGMINQYVMPWLAAFTGWIVNSWPVIYQYLADTMTYFWNWLTVTATDLWNRMNQEWIPAFVGWVTAVWPGFYAGLSALLSSLWGWIVDVSTMIWTQLTTVWVPAFTTWLVEVWPGFVAGLGALLSNLWNWITSTASSLLSNMRTTWGPALIDWIGATVPPMLAQLANWGLQLVNWILTVGVPELLVAALNLSTVMVDWVGDAAIFILPKLGEFIGGAIAWIIGTGIPLLLKAVAGLALALWGWVTGNEQLAPADSAWGRVGAALQTFLGKVLEVLTTQVLPGIVQMALNIAKGFLDGLATLFSAENMTWLGEQALLLGKAIVDGVVSSFTGGIESVKTGFTDFLGGIFDTGKEWLDTGSPSKRAAEELGKPIVEGIGQGMSSTDISSIATAVAEKILSAFDNLQADASEKITGMASAVNTAISEMSASVQSSLTGMVINSSLSLFGWTATVVQTFTDMTAQLNFIVNGLAVAQLLNWTVIHATATSWAEALRVAVELSFETLKNNIIAKMGQMSAGVIITVTAMRETVLQILGDGEEGLVGKLLAEWVPMGYDLGTDFAMGIADGIWDQIDAIAEAAAAAVAAAIAAARAAAEAASPSKRAAREIGAPFSLGIAKGIEDKAGEVARSAANTINAAFGGIDPALTGQSRSTVVNNSVSSVRNYNLAVNSSRDSRSIRNEFAVMEILAL